MSSWRSSSRTRNSRKAGSPRRESGLPASTVPRGLVAGQAAVGHAVRLGRLRTQPLDLVLLVGLEVALEPVPLSVIVIRAFVGEDVGSHPVEEPAVVGDDNRAAGEFQ